MEPSPWEGCSSHPWVPLNGFTVPWELVEPFSAYSTPMLQTGIPGDFCSWIMSGCHELVCSEPFSSVGKPLELWGLFPVDRNQFQGSHKCRFLLNIDPHQMKLFFPRYNQAHKTSGTNFQVHPSKIESLKEEMDEAGNKVEQCKVRTGWVSFPHLPWNCPTVQLQIMWLWHSVLGVFSYQLISALL